MAVMKRQVAPAKPLVTPLSLSFLFFTVSNVQRMTALRDHDELSGGHDQSSWNMATFLTRSILVGLYASALGLRSPPSYSVLTRGLPSRGCLRYCARWLRIVAHSSAGKGTASCWRRRRGAWEHSQRVRFSRRARPGRGGGGGPAAL